MVSARYILPIVFLLFMCATSQAQTVWFKALVISDFNAKGVALVNIVNTRTEKKALSNRSGFFRIEATPEDTIQLSYVGYETLLIPLKSVWGKADTAILMMASTSYKLDDVTIVYSNAKRDSIARKVAEILKTDPLLNNNDRILKRPRGGGFSGVITEMYYEFSKAGQDMVRFEQFVAYYREQQIIDQRYNKEIAKRVSGLDDYYLDDFIVFCRPERTFLLTAPEYDIYKHIQDCTVSFKHKYGLTE